jgi:2TM domain
MTTKISVDAYEAAERDVLIQRARKLWRRHAVTFALAVGLIALVQLGRGGTSWFVWFVLGAWAIVVAFHYRGWVRHGEARVRMQQSRIEWRAGRSNEHLVPKG